MIRRTEIVFSFRQKAIRVVPTQMFKEANRTWIDRVIATLHRSCFKGPGPVFVVLKTQV